MRTVFSYVLQGLGDTRTKLNIWSLGRQNQSSTSQDLIEELSQRYLCDQNNILFPMQSSVGLLLLSIRGFSHFLGAKTPGNLIAELS